MSATASMTLEEIQRVGLEALHRELGLVGMVRFLQSLGACRGDYTAERHEWLDKLDLDTIVEQIRKRRQEPQERADGGGDVPAQASEPALASE